MFRYRSAQSIHTMGVTSVIIKNDTDTSIKLQEGTAGVFLTTTEIKPKKSYTLNINPDATYREYACLTMPDNTIVQDIFSSDDVIELSSITISSDGKKFTLLYNKDEVKH
ncbi:hypothetical protein KC19_1G024600 [Ceratodon purpureus]|uniref:DUF7748 domain-containing protein n=1 Tax=Ceratodon purpureus TaxID=3225 RepID=A0A8T0J0M8_CERPU|nr:hypothetical protein KC19_1G024600 [Ceratodon purpureus]